jgi:hypothetical protein
MREEREKQRKHARMRDARVRHGNVTTRQAVTFRRKKNRVLCGRSKLNGYGSRSVMSASGCCDAAEWLRHR